MKKQPPPSSTKPPKRYTVGVSNSIKPSGGYFASLQSPEHAVRLARLTSEFVHLEDEMATVLAALLGINDEIAATHIMRAIKSPRGRIDVMRALLELAPRNQHKGREYDEILAEFWSINQGRNKYVHGMWWTSEDRTRAYIAEEAEPGFGFHDARPVSLKEMDDLIERIERLYGRITDL